MRRLVAVDLPAGQGFLDALHRAHDEGDAVLPVDRRLAAPARRRLFEALRPGLLVDESGRHELEGGVGTEPEDAFVVATSGTTGVPKGVVLTHRAVAASAAATSARLSVDPARDRWLCCLPLAHVGGLSVLTRAEWSGTPLELHGAFDRAEVLEAAARGVTLVSLVPTALYRLGHDADRFRRIVLGGSAPPTVLPGNVVCTYGLTESGSGVVYDGLPLDGVSIRLGEGGEISLAGPMLLDRYRDGRDPKDAEGFFATADAGTFDDEGRLVVLGRLDECINTGGEKVWPVAVEAVLSAHRGIAEVAVTGLPDPEWGSRVVALVVAGPGPGLDPGSEPPPVLLEELRELVRDELGPVAAPKQLLLTDHLPRTSIGKLARAEIAALASALAGEEPPHH